MNRIDELIGLRNRSPLANDDHAIYLARQFRAYLHKTRNHFNAVLVELALIQEFLGETLVHLADGWRVFDLALIEDGLFPIPDFPQKLR